MSGGSETEEYGAGNKGPLGRWDAMAVGENAPEATIRGPHLPSALCFSNRTSITSFDSTLRCAYRQMH
jgi:hypothetical protein